MALFQSGTYNLATIAEQSRFRWGVVPMPIGPVGRVSVTNGIAAAGNSATKHPDAVRQVLAWMGSTRGNQYLGARGAAIPAVLAAQRVYFDYWARRGVDVRPFFTVLDGPRIPAPGGRRLPRRLTRRYSRTSTRCSSDARMWRTPWAMRRRRRTLRPSANSFPAA